ncbi:MAG TPA: cation:proton antiporter, partial [Gemmatimonadales bacterium]|nr:cation:proton antiporter [Gemmatimonadales bacterium]
MRRPAILALLLGLMGLLQPLGSAGYGAQVLLTFGFLVLAAYTVGEVVSGLRGPKIVGYLLAGVLFGPSVLGVFPSQAVERLGPVSTLAVALIAFLAGAELRWEEVRTHGAALLKVVSAELGLGFVAIAGVMVGIHGWVPFLRDLPLVEVVVASLLLASVAVVHSPAVTMALLSETGARGPVARTTLGIVLLADVVVVLLFSTVLTLARSVVPMAGGGGPSPFLVAWEIGGALLVGAALGVAVTVYLRIVGHELFLVAILVALFGAEVARLLHVETLLTLVTAGFIAENTSRGERADALRQAMERSAAPVFVVFFALAGARIDLSALAQAGFIVVPLVGVRAFAIWSGVRVAARWAGLGEMERRYVWMGLVSQAGVAIGLATLLAQAYPALGPGLRTLLLAA